MHLSKDTDKEVLTSVIRIFGMFDKLCEIDIWIFISIL